MNQKLKFSLFYKTQFPILLYVITLFYGDKPVLSHTHTLILFTNFYIHFKPLLFTELIGIYFFFDSNRYSYFCVVLICPCHPQHSAITGRVHSLSLRRPELFWLFELKYSFHTTLSSICPSFTLCWGRLARTYTCLLYTSRCV